MHLRRIKIDNYGPVQDIDWELEPGITGIYGPNESGKTLLVEAIVKLLVDGKTGEFDTIDRVTGNPAGFLVAETASGSVQLPDGDYSDLFPDGTARTDIRNAFVIRDIDLRIPDRNREFGQGTYLRDVTDRITGSQTQKIEVIQERIAELGHLANKDSDRIMNRQPQKWRDRRDDATELIDDLEQYLEACRDEGILETVRTKRRLEQELEQIHADIEALERAATQEQFEAGIQLVDELRDIDEHMRRRSVREQEIEECRDMRVELERIQQTIREESHDPATYRRMGYMVVPLFALSLVAGIVSLLLEDGALGSVLFPIISTVLLGGVLFAAYNFYRARSHAATRDSLIDEAHARGVEGEDLSSVISGLSAIVEEFEQEERKLADQRSSNLGQLREKFGADHETLRAWEEELDAFEEQVEPVDRAFDEATLHHLQEQRQELRVEIDQLRENLRRHREHLSRLDGAIRDVNPTEFLEEIEDVRVESVEDLHHAIDVLEQFVNELEHARETARTAIDMFGELEAEEEEEINQLFTEDEFVVEMFRDVTDGNYESVWYDEELGIRVARGDGREVSPYELSQGTYDLLYLTIRLKLAQRLLDEQSGFLILDDAFVHSDASRITRELDVLEQLASADWQILYFSFRATVRDAIERMDHGQMIDLDRLAYGE